MFGLKQNHVCVIAAIDQEVKSGKRKENKQIPLAGLFNGSLLFTSKTSYFVLANNEYLVKNSHVYKIKADATDFLRQTLGQRKPNFNLIVAYH